MFAHDLHLLLAWATAIAAFAVASEACARTILRKAPDRLARVGLNLVLVLIGMTAAAGLAMLVRSERPKELLHLLYAILAFALVQVAENLAAHRTPRLQGLARLLGALITLGVIARLFAT